MINMLIGQNRTRNTLSGILFYWLMYQGVIILSSNAANVLVIPINAASHISYMGRLAALLQSGSHNVTFLLPSNARIPDDVISTNVTVATYMIIEEPYLNSRYASEAVIKLVNASFVTAVTTLPEAARKFLQSYGRECDIMLSNNTLVNLLESKHYDIALVDSIGGGCYFVLPYKLNIPWALVSIPAATWIYGNPALHSFVPSLMTYYTDDMNFMQRVMNLLTDSITYFSYNDTSYFMKLYASDKESLNMLQIIQRSSLWFMLSDISTSFPQPRMPNTIDIGDLMARDPQPLQKELLQFLEDSNYNEAILISFGSFFDYTPLDIAEKLCHVFEKLKMLVIWRSKIKPSCFHSKHIKILDWIPQNDLLGHGKVKLFITAGGLSSLIEAVYNKVPLIVFPLYTYTDQAQNAANIVEKGIGIKMDITDFRVNELRQNILKIIENSTYQERVSLQSEIMKSKMLPVGERVSFWVNHVTQYGSEHLKTKACHLNIFQFYMIDVFLFLVIMPTAFLFLWATACLFFIRKTNCMFSSFMRKVKNE